MEVSYRKSLNKSYMCVENPEHVFDTYELRMLNNCKVPGLLRLQVADLDNRQRYLYDISGKQQISDYLSRQKPGFELLRRILFSIQRICAVLPEYLLREDGICLEMNFIYVNLEDGSLQFTYLPFYKKNFPHSFQCCMEQILRMIDHQDQKAVELGYQTYQLCLQDNADIRKILMTVLCKEQVAQKEQNKNEVDLTRQERTSRKSPSSTQDSYQLAGESLGNKRKEKKIVVKERWSPKALPGIINRYFTKMAEAVNNFKKFWERKKQGVLSVTGVILKNHTLIFKQDKNQCLQQSSFENNSQEQKNPVCVTEILSSSEDGLSGKLVYRGIHDCEDLFVEGESFLIGKNEDQADGVISAEGVSRLHARIIRQEDRYFIEDLNSTNGTFLNESELEYHQPQELSKNDRIRFGVEEYVFF